MKNQSKIYNKHARTCFFLSPSTFIFLTGFISCSNVFPVDIERKYTYLSVITMRHYHWKFVATNFHLEHSVAMRKKINWIHGKSPKKYLWRIPFLSKLQLNWFYHDLNMNAFNFFSWSFWLEKFSRHSF